MAESKLEVDKTIELISSLTAQQRLALQACYSILMKGKMKIYTGQAYEVYRCLCQNEGTRALTQRRFCDMISFLDLYDLINARVVSMGRYRKTREAMGSLPERL